MTRRNLARNLLTSVVALLCAVVFAGADFAASAQNTNSSMTTQNDNMANMNMAPRRNRGRRGSSRRTRSGNANTGEMNANSTENTNTSDASMQNTNDNANSSGGSMTNRNTGRRGRGRRGRGRRSTPVIMPAETDASAATPAADTSGAMGVQENTGSREGTQEDLSGTYTGTVRTAGAHVMSTPATLTITGNQVTLAAQDGSMSHTGRISAVNTRGYVGVALRFDDMTDPANNLPASFSVRARKSGDRLTLTPAPNAQNQLWFTPEGGGGRRPRGRRGRRSAPPAPPAESATPPPAI
ncbi:MAG: hypothetical protein LC785_17770 [Acidobacteria bacterium]|nr:hypothetical protein [Acidobacteriota bacterium]MCA1643737.1 hypothetical protein [Acidobacteriota bacterium]